ncbi:flagellar motor protein MotB [Paenibacillus alginolyticus]|uniref:Flagellar motor protein MotB n=1 Tax=Paenibacillus alginolyticus TaxID=59839 RepID=A0ABT4G8A0_9BACL|nr:flagellar motor protein MotB [Paenibacillus alginolyticus]MCY9665061.1 flagellar motor protein MotB [Paenibacillus alginolyticus]MCY9692405.1 flagellar motor protein MotB [Paenibacillus alginolyticus]MEC0143622.1 flagellar motor protein MotB [Paenibacillus alginolyticus]
MARRGKKHEEHVNHERWLITYADLITLLLVFFIIMYAMSKVDVQKYSVLAQALNMQFQKADSVLDKGFGVSGQMTPKQGDADSKDKDATKHNVNDQKEEKDKTKPEESEKEKREKELQDLLKQVQAYINDQNLEAQVSASDTERGVAITLNDLFLFDLGKADLKTASYPILQKLASLIPTLNSKVSIEGHTDNLPLATGNPFKDNWGLSFARSLSVLRYFSDTAKLDNNKFIATAYADTMPKVANTSDENRSKNRRVEIIVLRDGLSPTTTVK